MSANLQNLRRFTSEEARENGRKGAKASAEVRRKNKVRKKVMTDYAKLFLDASAPPEIAEGIRRQIDTLEDSDEITLSAAVVYKQVGRALQGDREALILLKELYDRGSRTESRERFILDPLNFTVDFIEPYRQAKAALEPYKPNEDRSKRLREIISKGGRGSIKSSFWSAFGYDTMMNDPEAHIVFTRRYKVDLKDSVWQQWIRTVHRLGDPAEWDITSSPMRAVYKPTGQIVFFASADKPISKKSFETPFGYIKLMISEESDEMRGIEQLDNLEDTFLRKDTPALSIKIFNPPKSKSNFMNSYAAEKAADPTTLVCHSYFYNVPRSWLGDRFFSRAEEFKERKPLYYANNYLGEVTGTGGELFGNVIERTIDLSEADGLPTYQGIDWGYEHPQVFIRCAYDRENDRLYILHETYRQRTKLLTFLKATARDKSRKLDEELLQEYMDAETICDRDPNKIADAVDYGWNVIGATKKWKGGGRSYAWEWLREVTEIVIDPAVCPNMARELRTLEFEIVKSTGEYSSAYPDVGEDGVMALAYALNRVIMDYKRADEYDDYEYYEDDD